MTTDPHPGIAAAPLRADDADVAPAPTYESSATDQPVPTDPADLADPPGATAAARPARRGARRAESPSWWHTQHPVFTPLSGFFAGLLLVIALPSAYGAVLNLVLPDDQAEKLYPLALLVFLIPAGLIIAKPTRRFGRYLLLGMVLTAVVVLAAAALTILVLIKNDG